MLLNIVFFNQYKIIFFYFIIIELNDKPFSTKFKVMLVNSNLIMFKQVQFNLSTVSISVKQFNYSQYMQVLRRQYLSLSFTKLECELFLKIHKSKCFIYFSKSIIKSKCSVVIYPGLRISLLDVRTTMSIRHKNAMELLRKYFLKFFIFKMKCTYQRVRT